MESSHQRCSMKIAGQFRNIHRKTPLPETLFNKVAGLRPGTLLKRDSNTGVFLWILRNFKNTYFEEHLSTGASSMSRLKFFFRQGVSWKQASVQNFIFKWHLISELCQAKLLTAFVHQLLLGENEWVFVYT